MVLTACFHALTNFLPLTLVAKKETVSIDRVKIAFLDTNTRATYPPLHTHMNIPLHQSKGIQRQKTITLPPPVVVDECIGPKNCVRLYIYKMNPCLFLRLLPFSLLAFRLSRGWCSSHSPISSRKSILPPSDSATHWPIRGRAHWFLFHL